MKNLNNLSYFLNLKITKNQQNIFISQHKYTLNIIKKTDLYNTKPLRLPLNPKQKLHNSNDPLLNNPNKYRKLIDKLLYLITIKPDIYFGIQLHS